MRRSDQAGVRQRAGARRAVLAVALLALLFVAGALLAPVLDQAGGRWGGAIRLLYAPVCHQLPERSLTVDGAPLAVCARCTGLYLGGVVGLAAAAAWLGPAGRGPRPFWLGLALAPTVVDALLPWVGLPQLAMLPRLALALPAGAVAALYLAVGVADFVSPAPGARVRQPLTPFPALEEADG